MTTNLVLVLWSDHALTRRQIMQIAESIPRYDPSVRPIVVPHHKLPQLKLIPLWTQPTLSVSFFSLATRKLLPGRLLCGIRLHKHGEYARLDAAGIPVPRWTVVTPETKFDPDIWGPYIVEKPSAGRLGALVRIRKTTRMRFTPPESMPADHYGRDGPMIAQQFIYTGEWPTSYRVVTLFGDVLLCYRQVSRGGGYPLHGRWNFRDTGGISIVSNTKEMTIELTKDDDVIALAERAHREAIPDFPVLSFDIVRDCETGSLYVLECHAGGGWLFSSDIGLGIQASNAVDFNAQYGVIEKAAAILAREAKHRAVTPLAVHRRSLYRR